jgi:hypothetical protein
MPGLAAVTSQIRHTVLFGRLWLLGRRMRGSGVEPEPEMYGEQYVPLCDCKQPETFFGVPKPLRQQHALGRLILVILPVHPCHLRQKT